MYAVASSGLIADASDEDPIVITTAAPHGMRNGALVTLTGIEGNTAANGTYSISNVTANSFTIAGAVGNGTYTSGTGIWMAVEAVDSNLNAGLDVLRGATATVNSVQFQFSTAATSLVIPANGQLNATLTVADSFLITQSLTAHIAAQVKITHQNIPDLEAQLIAPDGTIIQLFSGVGVFGSNPHANMNDTLFDDFATTPIQNAGTPIPTGPFNPQLPLSALDGHGSAGQWRLVVTNHGSQAGVLDRWSIYLPKAAPSSGLGEVVADRIYPNFRIFNQDPANSLTTNAWTAMGPASQTQTTINDTSGRVGALAVDPSDPTGNTVYVGGATGGVWKTTNFLTTNPQGPTYVPLTDLGPAGVPGT
ncbi:MAG: proprotein convertase P-domain-containing protein, partial [Thermomicrobiales bacterium]